MESGREGEAERGLDSSRLELGESWSVDESSLNQFDDEKTDYLQRLESDRSLIEELKAAGFVGAHYDYFETEIAKYGIAVMTAWTQTRQVFAKLRERGRGGLPEPFDDQLRDHETASELAMETVAFALRNFRSYVLIPGRWDPDKGASIRTYFIGQCLIQFANVYRRWHTETYPKTDWSYFKNEAVLAARGYEHVEDDVQLKTSVDSTLSAVGKDLVKEMLVLYGAGHTHAEIGRALGTSTKKVEMAIRNERMKQMRGSGR